MKEPVSHIVTRPSSNILEWYALTWILADSNIVILQKVVFTKRTLYFIF